MNEFETFVQLVSGLGFGWQAMIVAAAILALVYAAAKGGVVATGDQKRIANVLLGVVFAGLSGNPQSEAALLAVLSSILAGLAKEGIEWLAKYAKREEE